MENTENRTIRDPSADTCFLGASVDEPPDPELAIEMSNATTSAMPESSASKPPAAQSSESADSTGSAPGVTRLKNPVATDTMNQAVPILPSGEEIDSKNTMQSFHARNPVNSGNDCDDLLVVTSTLPPADINIASNHPTLPSGEIIDSKNTLQSFNTRAAAPLTNPAPLNNNINSSESDLLPTAAAWIPPSQLSNPDVRSADTVYVAELVAPAAPRRNIILILVAFGIFAVVGASVIAGVCFSGNCGSNDPVNPMVASALSDYVNQISYFGQDIYANGTSAESQALNWLIQEDNAFSEVILLKLNSQNDGDEVRRRVRQRYSLATLNFQKSSSENWESNKNWLSKNECRWFGITCDESGSVTEILFFNYTTEVANGYVGSIPPDIGLLTSLRNFSLRSNDVTGKIPGFLGNCSQMYIFDIRGVSVAGTLPQSLGSWKNLFSFDVSQNEFSGSLPAFLGLWTNLYSFNISQNKFTGTLPSSLGFWTDLPSLDVSENELDLGPLIESTVSDFVNIISFVDEVISLNGTSAESLALKWVGDSEKGLLFMDDESAILDLSALQDDYVSLRVRQRYALATLWFQQTDDEGVFIKTWTTTTGWLTTNECIWFGITCDENGSVTEITFYDYDGVDESNAINGFVGSIPPDIGLLTSLQLFSMRSNDVTGTIPESIGQCNKMKLFDISGGSVIETLPSSLGLWTDLLLFDVSENEIIGSMPESTSSWIYITGFSVFSNQLSGSIPSFVTQWSRLNFFAMYGNKLTGTVPEDFGNLVGLSNFAINSNLLTGTLPPSIGRMTTLQYFYVDDNLLTGTIPSSIGNWSQIEIAYFGTNQFTGTMPPGICTSIQDGDVLQSNCEVNCTCCTLACLS
jgi:Leucine-rich repeat (LRR) protein